MKQELTVESIRRLVSYDAETGTFTRLVPGGNGVKAGDRTGYVNAGGYVVLSLCDQKLYAHRVAWLLTHGEWPTKFIDHIDGDKQNNRIENLRNVSNQLNTQNIRAARGASSGLLGAYWDKQKSKWMSLIMTNGRSKFLGYHQTPEGAHAAYMNAKSTMHEGFVA